MLFQIWGVGGAFPKIKVQAKIRKCGTGYGRISHPTKEDIVKCYDCDGTGFMELNQVFDIEFIDETHGAICTECDGYGVASA